MQRPPPDTSRPRRPSLPAGLKELAYGSNGVMAVKDSLDSPPPHLGTDGSNVGGVILQKLYFKTASLNPDITDRVVRISALECTSSSSACDDADTGTYTAIDLATNFTVKVSPAPAPRPRPGPGAPRRTVLPDSWPRGPPIPCRRARAKPPRRRRSTR